MYPLRKTKTLAERFWAKVAPPNENGCMLWTGSVMQFGHGRINRGRAGDGIDVAHRVSWELANGPIPEGMCVLHKCDVPACVNPDHLFLGTHADNIADKVSKGRQARGFMFPHTKLSDEQVAEIRHRYITEKISQRALAEEYGVCQQNVNMLVNNRRRV
jgi:HNH endonuclease